MQFKQVLLVFAALVTLAYSSPTGAEQNTTINFAQNVSDASDAPEAKKSLTRIVEDKNPKSNSVVVEFVYNSKSENSKAGSKGVDKDKYTVDSSPQKPTQDQTKNLNDKGKGKLVQELTTQETAQSQVNKTKSNSSQASKDFHMKVATSLMPEEVSPLSGKWPKFYFDIFNPIKPFPELQYDRPNQISTQKLQRENADIYLPYYEKERKEPINVAGPPLRPLSIYDREFNVPIFD